MDGRAMEWSEVNRDVSYMMAHQMPQLKGKSAEHWLKTEHELKAKEGVRRGLTSNDPRMQATMNQIKQQHAAPKQAAHGQNVGQPSQHSPHGMNNDAAERAKSQAALNASKSYMPKPYSLPGGGKPVDQSKVPTRYVGDQAVMKSLAGQMKHEETVARQQRLSANIAKVTGSGGGDGRKRDPATGQYC